MTTTPTRRLASGSVAYLDRGGRVTQIDPWWAPGVGAASIPCTYCHGPGHPTAYCPEEEQDLKDDVRWEAYHYESMEG